jgi:hypothetical protein
MKSNSRFSTSENTEYDSLMIKEKIELELNKNIIKEPQIQFYKNWMKMIKKYQIQYII